MATPTATVVISGGAPNGALTAGALAGIYESGKTFNTFYTSGAGAVFGLLTVAGKAETPVAALKGALKRGIHDAIYQWVPLGFKTFFKSGPFTQPLKKFGDALKLKESDEPNDFSSFFNDWIDLWISAVTPTGVNFRSQAVCAPFPFLDQFIDFKKLETFREHGGRFYMNAYCIETGEMEDFGIRQIMTAPEKHFNAALAYPFIYPPGEIGSRRYYEGSTVDPLNLPNLERRIQIDSIPTENHTIVLIDVLGALKRSLIRLPRHLIDAYGISIMTPIVSLAETRFELFTLKSKMQVQKLTFDIPEPNRDKVTDWSRTNLKELFAIGHQAGTTFCKDHPDWLPNRVGDTPYPAPIGQPPAVA